MGPKIFLALYPFDMCKQRLIFTLGFVTMLAIALPAWAAPQLLAPAEVRDLLASHLF